MGLSLIDDYPQELLYFLFVMTMSLVLPVVIMLASYLTIVLVILRRARTFSTSSKARQTQ